MCEAVVGVVVGGVAGSSLQIGMDLEGAPYHAAFRACHAANDHAGVFLGVLRNGQTRFRSTARVGAGHGS